jgi:hypothetical protein
MTASHSRAAALAASRVALAPPERWQHGQDCMAAIAPRMPTQVASGVLALRKAKSIGDCDVTAAERFGRDYLFGIEGVRDPPEGGGSSGGNVHDVQIARAFAITCHRAVANVIGGLMTQWLISFLVLDLSFAAMAARFMPSRSRGCDEMKGRLTTLLMILSGVYASIDGGKRRVDRVSTASCALQARARLLANGPKRGLDS